ncbi:MAG: hypothetical protein WBZ16_19850 [Pseudolabrys sp.]
MEAIEADNIERCAQAVWDAGGDNVEFHVTAIRALKQGDGQTYHPGDTWIDHAASAIHQRRRAGKISGLDECLQ